MNANSQKRHLSCPFDYIVHSACFVYLDACLLGSLESNSFKPNYWPPQWPLLITVQCPKETDINSSEKTVPLASTSRPDLASLTTPSDEINQIPEFGIIEFTTETETPNSTEILIQQSSSISTVSKMLSITTNQNQEIETLQTMESIATTNTPVESPELLLVTPSSKVLETSTSTDVIDFDKNFNNNSAPDPETTIQNQEIKTLQTTENIVTTNTPVETPELLLVTPNLTVLETLPSIDVIDFDENFNDNLAPDPEAFSVFLDVLFDQFNESGSSSTPKFTDILFATLNETLEKVPKEDNFASLLFANLPSKEV